MKKLFAIFTLIVLVFSSCTFGFLNTGVSATELEETLPVVSFLLNEDPICEDIPEAPAVTPAEEPAILTASEPSFQDASDAEPEMKGPQDVVPEVTNEEDFAEDEVIFSQVDEVIYAITDVNVRSGPSTDFSKIGILEHSDSVIRTGIGDNGWSKVIFEGLEGYVCSKYLFTSELFYGDSVSFEDVEETVYATTTVNVRTGPGTEYEALDQYYQGNRITRTGIGDNGWSRVEHDGKTAYIHSNYLSKSQPRSGLKEGMYGRLTIPSVGVNVGLYYCSSSSDNASYNQSVVDGIDSAAYLDQDCIEGALIADHKHQGFSAIRGCVANETYAYIDYGTHTQTYICTAVGVGHNTGDDLVDWNGVSLNYDHISGGLAMYTCNENWNNITITYWQAV